MSLSPDEIARIEKELGIIKKHVSNFWVGRASDTIKGIVFHIMQSSEQSAWSWFNNPKSEASSHYGITLDGVIYEYVNPVNAAWGNGIVNKPANIEWIIEAVQQRKNINNRSISIEHEGNAFDTRPSAQIKSSINLANYLSKRFNIPVNPNTFIGHYKIDSVNRPNCPSSSFPLSNIIESVNTMQNTNVENTDAKYFPETEHDNISGSGFWVVNVVGAAKINFLDKFKQLPFEIIGFPISGAYLSSEYLDEDNKPMIVQWYERARMEYHVKQGIVMLGLLGQELVDLGHNH